MKSHEQVGSEIDRYHQTYRHPDLPFPRISDVYHLFPDSEFRGSQNAWPNDWPNNGSPGVYVVFDQSHEILYIGKATDLGKRLSSYFHYAPDGGCKYNVEHWATGPASLMTAAFDHHFEAVALEAYLIDRLQPRLNRQGIRR